MSSINTTPPVLDIFAYAGSETTLTFDLTDGENPIDISSGMHTVTMAAEQGDATVWELELTVDPEVVGRAYLMIPEAESAEAAVDAVMRKCWIGNEVVEAPMWTGVWEWDWLDGTINKTLVFGKITIIAEVA